MEAGGEPVRSPSREQSACDLMVGVVDGFVLN